MNIMLKLFFKFLVVRIWVALQTDLKSDKHIYPTLHTTWSSNSDQLQFGDVAVTDLLHHQEVLLVLAHVCCVGKLRGCCCWKHFWTPGLIFVKFGI